MVDDELVEQLRQAYGDWIQGNPDPAVALLADDVTWALPGNSAVSGTYRGIEEVQGFWMSLAEHLRGLEVHELLAGGDHIAVLNKVELTAG
ncbi:MAG: nuclear transport factor 2 family protein [Thermoleophilia bacterium]|nr:nuclear transport factor 2 family protein [Thermoleophilia bacterium]